MGLALNCIGVAINDCIVMSRLARIYGRILDIARSGSQVATRSAHTEKIDLEAQNALFADGARVAVRDAIDSTHETKSSNASSKRQGRGPSINRYTDMGQPGPLNILVYTSSYWSTT